MPGPTTFQLLVRQGPLTREDWVALIEARVQQIKHRLDWETLDTLGTHQLSLTNGATIVLDTGLSLTTQGIFYSGTREYHGPHSPMGRPGKVWIWGLTRDVRWVLTQKDFHPAYRSVGSHQRLLDIVDSVDGHFVDLLAILEKVDARSVWGRFSSVVKEWEERAKSRLAGAKEILARMKFEDELLAAMHDNAAQA